MTDKALFGVLIRAIGVVLGILALQNYLSALAIWIVSANSPGHPDVSEAMAVPFWSGVWMMALGIYLIRGAPKVIELAYPMAVVKPSAERKSDEELNSAAEQLKSLDY